MNTLVAFAMSQNAIGQKQKVFDWNKAATIIKERNPEYAFAGLSRDWEYTGGTIYDKEIGPLNKKDTYTYLSSNWATPELKLLINEEEETIHCWKYEDELPGWDANTYWPESALEILRK